MIPGIYKDCEIDFIMELRDYPLNPTLFALESNIFHPNIAYETFSKPAVGLNQFIEWSSYDVKHRIIVLFSQNLFQELILRVEAVSLSVIRATITCSSQ